VPTSGYQGALIPIRLRPAFDHGGNDSYVPHSVKYRLRDSGDRCGIFTQHYGGAAKNARALIVWPTGKALPNVSTLNVYTAGTVVANAAIVPAGTSGAINAYVTDATDLVIDIDGYFAPPAANGLKLYPVTPCRVADTRVPSFRQAWATVDERGNATILLGAGEYVRYSE